VRLSILYVPKSCYTTIIGIQPWEDKYEEMAKAMGIDPSVSFTYQ
jgi:hypothetical protein